MFSAEISPLTMKLCNPFPWQLKLGKSLQSFFFCFSWHFKPEKLVFWSFFLNQKVIICKNKEERRKNVHVVLFRTTFTRMIKLNLLLILLLGSNLSQRTLSTTLLLVARNYLFISTSNKEFCFCLSVCHRGNMKHFCLSVCLHILKYILKGLEVILSGEFVWLTVQICKPLLLTSSWDRIAVSLSCFLSEYATAKVYKTLQDLRNSSEKMFPTAK